MRDVLDPEHAAGADTVFDHNALAETLSERLRHNARDNVGAAAGGKRHNELDGFGRPLRGCALRVPVPSRDHQHQQRQK